MRMLKELRAKHDLAIRERSVSGACALVFQMLPYLSQTNGIWYFLLYYKNLNPSVTKTVLFDKETIDNRAQYKLLLSCKLLRVQNTYYSAANSFLTLFNYLNKLACSFHLLT